MQQKPLEILVTNDDSYHSKGIKTLANILSNYGNVTVVAPKEVQSGKSVAITMERPLRLTKISQQTENNGNSIIVYSFDGTPSDCVKIAMNEVITDGRRPDFLCSGINHGSNASAGSIYSGTLGATIEGTLYSVPSIGLSIDTHSADPDFTQIEEFVNTVIKNFIANPPAENVYLNVNFPAIPKEQIKGIKFASQAEGMWIKEFEKRTDPFGKDYFWMVGEFINKDKTGNGDHTLMKEGYITIVPHNIDNTNYKELDRLNNIWKF